MANLHFSWSDSIHAALSSCLPCLQSSDDHHDNDQQEQFGARQRNGLSFVVPPPRARPDELEGLLADSDSPDAETLSLHSNIGDERRRKKRRKPRKGITLFGYNLFGKPPIHLPDSDDEDTASSRRSRTISTSTLDSDAAPLDASVLDEQAVARLAAATAAAEEEQRKAKEERRRLRRERRELKRMALAMAMNMHQQHGEGEFEGFPGSGPSLSDPSVGPGSGSLSTASPFEEEFGPFAQGEDALEDDADFGAETYVRRATTGASASGSDSQSRTSASLSNVDNSRYHHHYLSQVSPLHSPLPATADAGAAPKKKKRSRGKSLSSKQSDEHSNSASSLLTSQSPSLPSPPPTQIAFEQSTIAPIAESGSQFEGFPGGTLGLAREQALAQEATKATDAFPSTGLPSVGLRGVQRTKSDMGVFLANRGEQ
ncbi:hypothetical protein FOMPIDRAFT_1039569 [Fomitopsis schrenkii]|uniref:Uncharacterized protein n=1 Tax=Fomitopsis schrenkii TaxID=2126942 RepID=S8EL33_FOMSC|nr:hypothetical protein FOMPIDRAFT_1039569 [Fomitopsis schrenkii]